MQRRLTGVVAVAFAVVVPACGSRARERVGTSLEAVTLDEGGGDSGADATNDAGDSGDDSTGDEGGQEAGDDAGSEAGEDSGADAGDAASDAVYVTNDASGDANDDAGDAGDAGDANDNCPLPPSCDTGQRWCTETPGNGPGECVDEIACDGTSCTCTDGTDDDDSTLEGCTAPDSCAQDDPTPTCATCCASCAAANPSGYHLQDATALIVWDETKTDCVDSVTGQPTAVRNPTPGPCGTLTGDHEAFIQSIADVTMQNDPWQAADVQQLLDFHGKPLQGMVFHGEFAAINLEGADLRKADLSDASFFGANMRGVDLRWSNMRGTFLIGSDLSVSRSGGVRKPALTYMADATGAQLSFSRFDGAYLMLTNFNGISAPSAVFDGAMMSCADFTNAEMPNASFVGSILDQFANSTCVSRLTGADLRMTDWRGARVRVANAGNADLSYSVWCGSTASAAPFLQSTENGEFVTNVGYARNNRNRGILYVPAARCAQFTPSTSVKFDQRVANAFDLLASSGQPNSISFYDWGNFPDWEENGTPPTDRYNPDLNRNSPAWPLLENGTLINIARPKSDGLPERGIIYLLRMGSSFVVYTNAPFPNGISRQTPGNGSGQTWWERRVVARGRAAMVSNPEIVSQAFYYDRRDISALQNLAFGLELATNVLTLVPGLGTYKIVLENVMYDKPIWSQQNVTTMVLDLGALATFGATKLAKLPALAQTLRVGAVVSLASGMGLQSYNAYDAAVNQNYLGAAVDVGSVVIGGLLIRKNISDFYQTRQFLQRMADYRPVDFPPSPLKLTGDAEKDKAVRAFAQWMAERSTGAQMDLGALQSSTRGNLTAFELTQLSDGLGNLRYQKAVEMANRSGNANAIREAEEFGRRLAAGPGGSGNWDPWGVYADASVLNTARGAARQEIGNIIRGRLNGAESLTNEWQTLDGQRIQGVRLRGGAEGQRLYDQLWGRPGTFSPAYLTETAGPTTANAIFQDGMTRWAGVLNGTYQGDAALAQFAQGLQAYYQGMRYARGGDAVGRAFGAAVFRKAFGRRIVLPELVDGRAYAMDQCQFTAYLVPILRQALQ
jgi:uncharacterized protein YjbI with pentapeptide repeats